MAPIPPCFHPETGIHEALAAELVADLPHFGLDALSRRSFVLPERIVELAEAHAATIWVALKRGRFKPVDLGVDTVYLSKAIADKPKTRHVNAADPARRLDR